MDAPEVSDYARLMPTDNQAPPGRATPDPAGEAPPAAGGSGPEALPPFGTEVGPAPVVPPARRWLPEQGLLLWFSVCVALGAGGLLFGQEEMAALGALAGLSIAAQAADLDSRWRALYYSLTWVVPVGGAATFAATTILIAQSDLPGVPRWIVLAISVASGFACLATLARPVSDPLTRRLFHVEPPTHHLRLAARIVVAGLLLAVPGWFAFRNAIQGLLSNSDQLLDKLPTGGGLVGYVLLAFASVGFLVRRDLRATLDRLGLRGIGLRGALVVALGVGAIYGLNFAADSLQHRVFPDLWKSDQTFNEALAGGLTPFQTLMLGLSAGVGEEITLRGALQPRLGLVLTSLLFAALHVQYSWYGMAVIFVLGLVLGAIRQRSSTSVAIAVHAIYDMLAVATTPK
jgi:MFS family permease